MSQAQAGIRDMHRRRGAVGIVLGIAVLTGTGSFAPAETEEASSAASLGKVSYERYCASCHGLDGRGGGDLATVLKHPPMDLTAIAERRDGSFPATEIAEIIDGRQMPRAHGTTEMPVWGERLRETGSTDPGGGAALRGEIYLVVQYLRSLQPDIQQGAETPEVEAKKIAQLGEVEFMHNCASCHGKTGTGEGYVGTLLAEAPPNLRTIAKRNGGSFPTLKIARVIDGRDSIVAHGPRGMPVWGGRLRALGGVSRGSAVRGEIMLYVSYLRTIQEP